MDELIKSFVDETFTNEATDLINDCFNIFNAYKYDLVETNLIDVINNQSYASAGDTQDIFIREINKHIDVVLSQHEIVINEDIDLNTKVEILKSLKVFENLEDYTSIILQLESLEDDYVILAGIISDMCMLEQNQILSAISSFNPSLLTKMKTYIYNITKNKDSKEHSTEESNVIKNLKLFLQFVNKECLASQIIKSNTLLAQSFSSYLPYFTKEEIVSKDDDTTALNLLSLILISSNGFNDPVTVYRKYSYSILEAIEKTSLIEGKILGLLANFSEYKKANDEKIRLSKTNN